MQELKEKILSYIERNSRIDLHDLAVMLGEDEAQVLNALEEMEQDHIIAGYHTLINWEKAGIEKAKAMIEVRVSPQHGVGFDRIAQHIYNYPEVSSVYLISGGFDFMVIIEGRTLKEIAEFVSTKLSTLESVFSTKTNFILKNYKEEGTIMAEPPKDERMKMSL